MGCPPPPCPPPLCPPPPCPPPLCPPPPSPPPLCPPPPCPPPLCPPPPCPPPLWPKYTRPAKHLLCPQLRASKESCTASEDQDETLCLLSLRDARFRVNLCLFLQPSSPGKIGERASGGAKKWVVAWRATGCL